MHEDIENKILRRLFSITREDLIGGWEKSMFGVYLILTLRQILSVP
jgi:hypothetical protein